MATDTKFVRGAARLAQRIRTIRENTRLPPMVDELSELLLARTLVRFEAQVDPDGKKWPELSDAVKKRKQRKGQNGKMLQDTKQMKQSIRVIRGQAVGLLSLTGAGARIGITDPERAKIGRYHNNGTEANPQRRFLGIGALDVKAVDGYLRRRADKTME